MSANNFRKSPESDFKKAIKAYLSGINAYLAKLKKSGERPKHLLPTPDKYTLEDLYACLGGLMFGFPAFGMYSDILTNQLVSTLKNPSPLSELNLYTGSPVNESFPKRNNLQKESYHFKRIKFLKPFKGKNLKKVTDFQRVFSKGIKNSNSWALSGKITATGKPFLSSDSHIALFKPDTYYEAHLVYPGQNLYGLFFPMTPICGNGFNQNAGWGVTILLNDDVDLYEEKVNPKNANQVWENDHWENIKIRKEVLKILQANGTLKDSVLEIRSTRHGPIINNVDQKIKSNSPVSLFYTGFKFPDSVLKSFFGMNTAKNLPEFTKAVGKHVAPGFNIQYADKQGNIAWFAAAKLLKRPSHILSKMFLDGASGKDEPLGFYPFSMNPKSINPPEGYVYSANNQIGMVDGKLYPGYYVAGLRAKRIKNILGSGKKFSSKDLQKLFLDNVSNTYQKMAKLVLKELEGHPILSKTRHHKKAVRILRRWKGAHKFKSKAPIIFYQLYYQLLKNYLEDEVGTELFELFFKGDAPLYGVIDRSFEGILFNETSVWVDDVNTKDKKETRKDLFVKSFSITVDSLIKRELLNKRWRHVHKHNYVSIPALFTGQKGYDVGPLPLSGGVNTIHKTELDLKRVNDLGDYSVSKTHGPGNRTLIDLSDIDRKSLGVLPTGQSGFPESKFYKDQAKIYMKGKLRKMLRLRSEIEKVSTRLVLKK